MKVQDVMDLKAYLDTLDPVDHAVGSHDLGFPWSVRRGIGLWKIRYLEQGPVTAMNPDNPEIERGRYLVEGAGHCGECHTPRDWLGGPRYELWLAGAADPEGEGRVPNITPLPDGFGAWSASDITWFLQSGFKPDYDTVGGSMVKVQEHLARLPEADLEAITAYLKAIPARP
jgi:mono/diheme cytochrome c family protein